MAADLSVIDNRPSTSTAPIYVWVSAYADPTGSGVSFAAIPAEQTEPAPGDYQAGAWVNDPITPNVQPIAGTATIPAQRGRWLARLPIGALTPATHYEVYVKLGLDGSVHRAGLVRTL